MVPCATVIGIGEILWDVFPDGPRFGGAPANFACSVAGLVRDRIDVYMAGGVGADDPGRRAVEALHLHGVDTSCVAVVDRPTGQVLVKLDAAGRGSYEFAADVAHPSLASVDDQVIAGLEECAEDGTPSFHGSFEGARGREALDEGSLWRLLNLARSREMMAVIHAEEARLNREVIRQTDNAGALENVARCRPWFSETAAVQRSVFMSQITRGPIYFEHLGAGPSLDVVGTARRCWVSCLWRDLPTLSLLLGRDLSDATRRRISQVASFEKERRLRILVGGNRLWLDFFQWPRTSH